MRRLHGTFIAAVVFFAAVSATAATPTVDINGGADYKETPRFLKDSP
jgi:hypothetical protein